MMVGLGMLKAIEHALTPDHGGWSVAWHMELGPSAESGLMKGRGRAVVAAAAARDQRDHQRTLTRGGGHHQQQQQPWHGAGRGDRRRTA